MGNWYDNPLRWVDESDLFDLSGHLTIHTAIDTLKDKLVHRATDDAVMVRGLFRSVKAQGLTRKQQSAVDLAREAMTLDVTPTMYVAEKLGIHRSNAWRLLRNADARLQPKSATFERKFDIYNKSIAPTITEKDIQRTLQSMKVECAGCGKRLAPARTCLCHPCIVEYGLDGERPAQSEWLDKMVRITRQDARKRAIERLMLVDGELMVS